MSVRRVFWILCNRLRILTRAKYPPPIPDDTVARVMYPTVLGVRTGIPSGAVQV